MTWRLLPIVAAAALSLPAAAQPPGAGTISIEAAGAGGERPPVPAAFRDALADALAARGFTILDDPGHSAFIAELKLTRTEVGTGLGKPATGPKTLLPGGAYGSVGAGLTIPLASGKTELMPLQRTQLELDIRKRETAAPSWHGAAVTVRAAGTRDGVDGKVAADLSDAVLRAYPAEPTGVVGVP